MEEKYYKFIYNDEDSSKMFFLCIMIPLFLGLVLTIILNLIANSVNLKTFVESPILYCVYLLLINSSLLILFFLYNKKNNINFIKASLIKIKFGWINLILSITIAFVTLFGFLYFINYLTYLLQTIGYNPDSSLPLPLSNAGWLILNIIILAVVPAICEELIYRGVIFNGLRKFGSLGAVVISALIFALAHGSAMQFFYQFILGVVLAIAVLKSGSIITSMVIHFLNNTIVVVYNYIFNDSNTSINYDITAVLMSFLFAIIAGLLIWFLFNFMREYKHNKDGESTNEEYKTYYKDTNKKFSNSKSTLLFFTALIISIAIWITNTITV